MPYEFGGANTADTSLTNITSGGGVGVVGSPVELISSTARASNSISVLLQGSTTKASFRGYITTGAIGSEVDVLPFVFYSGDTGQRSSKGQTFEVPLSIPAGTRVSARCASGVGSEVMEVAVGLGSDGLVTPGANELVGTTGSGVGYMGTSIDPGGSTNTKPSSFTEIVASTSHAYQVLTLFVGINNASASAKADWLIDIATGAELSESIILADIFQSSSTSEDGPLIQTFAVNIPSGTRISARAQCTNGNAAKRQVDIAILGVNATASGGGGSTVTTGFAG